MSFDIETAMREHAQGINNLTAETKAALKASKDDLALLSDNYKSLADQVIVLAQRSGSSMPPFNAGPRRPYEAFLKSAQLEALRKGANSTGRVELPGINIKALTSLQFPSGSPQEGYDVQPARDPGLYADPRRSLRLLDVLRRIEVGSNRFEYHRIAGYTNQATYQAAEGAQKQETQVPPTLEYADIVTIAHFLKVSKQVIADVPALQAQLDDLLRFGVAAKLESEIINGSGAGEIQGLLAEGTTFVPTANNGADRVSESISFLEASGWSASAVLMHPNSWHTIRTERGEDLQYVAGGWNMPAAPSMWNVPVVATASMPQGTCIVLDGSQVLLLDRMQPQMMLGMDGNDFTSNLWTLLAELRAGLAVLSPTAVQVFGIEGSP